MDEGLIPSQAAVRQAYGLADEGWRFAASMLIDDLVGDARNVLLVLFSTSLLVLLIA